jgi:hypothetical protein
MFDIMAFGLGIGSDKLTLHSLATSQRAVQGFRNRQMYERVRLCYVEVRPGDSRAE